MPHEPFPSCSIYTATITLKALDIHNLTQTHMSTIYIYFFYYYLFIYLFIYFETVCLLGMYQMKVERKWVISFHKPTFTKPLRAGTWTVKLVYNNDIVHGEVKFLIIPQAFFEGKAATLEQVIGTNNGPPDGLYSSDFVIEFDREANDTQDLVKEFSENSSSIGSHFDDWVDKHVQKHLDLEANCAVVTVQLRKCGGLKSCRDTSWSSKSPDPKSEVGNIVVGERLS